MTRKAFAYVTNRGRLLVFSHPNSPDAGMQVPGGTIEGNEQPVDAAMREAQEETGLTDLVLVRYVGEQTPATCRSSVKGRPIIATSSMSNVEATQRSRGVTENASHRKEGESIRCLNSSGHGCHTTFRGSLLTKAASCLSSSINSSLMAC